jgi:threonylcarbamoyladenosine tRNA methylthiotransferase MtaB
VAVRRDVHAALEGGAKEIVLTGVHLGSWGQDFGERSHLRQLVAELLAIADLPRLRLSSLEPWDLDVDFFRLWQDPRLCRHLHLPLQSGSAATLRRMARNTTPSKFARLVESARKQIDDLALTTDIIVGFPGETEHEFQESLDFVKGVGFADAHVFSYSERAGTAAAAMPGMVPHTTRKERSRLMRRLITESGTRYRRRFIGSAIEVLWEGAEPAGDGLWNMVGLSDNYLRVEAEAGRPRWNQFEQVQLSGLTERGLLGSLTQPEPAYWFVDA